MLSYQTETLKGLHKCPAPRASVEFDVSGELESSTPVRAAAL